MVPVGEPNYFIVLLEHWIFVMSTANCVFCGICAKKQPAEFLYEDDEVVVFKDIKPAAKHHYLSVPIKHIQDVNKLTREDKPLSTSLQCVVTSHISKNTIF